MEWRGVGTLEIKERVSLKIEFIKTAAQILGGAFFLFGLYFTWANLVVSQEKFKTDLYVQAINQVGSHKPEVRLGGIYALERIARDSEKDHWPIMEVLTAYVRENAPWPPEPHAKAKQKRPWAKEKHIPKAGETDTLPEKTIKPDPDIQAILTVIGRRARTFDNGETQSLDLRDTDLRGADLRKGHLERALVMGAHLEGANLNEAHLEGADLVNAYLEGTLLNRAYLGGAYLIGAHLEGARLGGAHLERALLMGAHLERADLMDARLMEALLNRSHLGGALLWRAHLEGAYLTGAHLEGADLRGATGLTRKQIAITIINDKTKLPDYLQTPKPEKPGFP